MCDKGPRTRKGSVAVMRREGLQRRAKGKVKAGSWNGGQAAVLMSGGCWSSTLMSIADCCVCEQVLQLTDQRTLGVAWVIRLRHQQQQMVFFPQSLTMHRQASHTSSKCRGRWCHCHPPPTALQPLPPRVVPPLQLPVALRIFCGRQSQFKKDINKDAGGRST